MVIAILMRFYSIASNWSVASRIMPHKGVRHSTNCGVIMTSNYFWQYIAWYTVTNCWRYPVRRRVTKASTFEWFISVLNERGYLIHLEIHVLWKFNSRWSIGLIFARYLLFCINDRFYIWLQQYSNASLSNDLLRGTLLHVMLMMVRNDKWLTYRH